MKFSYYLEKITGVSVYPMISLILFMVFFTAVLYIALRSPKEEMERLKNLPNEN